MKKYTQMPLSTDDPRIAQGKGKNKIPEPEKEPLWRRYLEKFRDPLILILLGALVLSVIGTAYEIWQSDDLHLLFEPVGVLCAILLATGVGFIFEVKADREFDVLNQVRDQQPVKVLRRPAGSEHPQMYSIPKQDVVVGDIVRIESGDQIPADGTLLESNELLVDESAFTGEPSARKYTNGTAQGGTAYPPDYVLRGSTVMEGNGIFLVQKIAIDSEEGRGVALTREGSNVRTPLNRQLDQLGKWISVASFVIAALIIVGRMAVYFSSDAFAGDSAWEVSAYLLQSVMIAVTLIVVAVPEGLPMSVTVSLALSMRQMLRQNNLVRKLHACETMGAATVICTDKTGTLTQNCMSVVDSSFEATMDEIARAIAVNSTAALQGGAVVGNPTEGALLKWIEAQGYDYQQLRESARVVRQEPFSSATKRMLTEVETADGSHIIYIKGAPELLLAECDAIAGDKTREDYLQLLADYQSRAYRTLGFMTSSPQDEASSLQKVREKHLFLGIVAIADPIRPDVPEAIRQCREDAGVKVIIVTGDTVGTANEIGRQIGLLQPGETDRTLTGADFAAMPDKELRSLLAADRIRIISRARPEDKARLVTLLQQNREVVAVTGDGTNDAPALSKAHVGLSMGSGTSRAKDASDITIIDDSFTSINKAIMWGRSIYQNIRRFILYQMTINVCACLVVLLGAVVGIDSPLNVTQMLWVNLIMDTFAAGALSALPADPRVLHEAPRSPRAHIIDRPMALRIASWGLGFFVVLTALWQLLFHYDAYSVAELFTSDELHTAVQGFFEGHHGKLALSPYEHGIFFSAFVLLQFWNLFNVRYYRTDRCFLLELHDLLFDRPRFRSHFSSGFTLVAIVILVGQFAIVNLLPDFFEVESLTLADWGVLLAVTSLVFILPELIRSARLLRHRTSPHRPQ